MEDNEIDWFALMAPAQLRNRNEPEATPTPVVEVSTLEREWLRIRREVEYAMDRNVIPGNGFVYDPRLDILKARIREQWETLPTEESLAECLSLVRKMHDHVAATLFGYGFLRGALLLRGASRQAEVVSDFEVAYLSRHDIDPAKVNIGVSGEEKPRSPLAEPQPAAEDDD